MLPVTVRSSRVLPAVPTLSTVFITQISQSVAFTGSTLWETPEPGNTAVTAPTRHL